MIYNNPTSNIFSYTPLIKHVCLYSAFIVMGTIIANEESSDKKIIGISISTIGALGLLQETLKHLQLSLKNIFFKGNRQNKKIIEGKADTIEIKGVIREEKPPVVETESAFNANEEKKEEFADSEYFQLAACLL